MAARCERNAADARARIGAFIEQVCNRDRLHSAFDYLNPEEYEAASPHPQGNSPGCNHRDLSLTIVSHS